ncbi:hypothetical protein DFP75_105113 [Marinomonas alcarazii]|uniref:Uncharacterized protein n=1 Tax=Marinomonas alcarazii TaxID=491949 RepID=A0A318UZD3_9GAMM|nr:hypothetical protein DFP75_105113 [Marinomonas alcarazii]
MNPFLFLGTLRKVSSAQRPRYSLGASFFSLN